MLSSIGFHTISLLLPLKADEVTRLLRDFFHYSSTSKNIIIKKQTHELCKSKYESYSITDDTSFNLPLTTIIYYRKDIGIRWKITSTKPSQLFNSYVLEVKINPKILSGIDDYLTAATLCDMENVISKFNQETKKISPLLKDFSYYKLIRVDYCINFSINELVPGCTPEQVINLIKRADIPPSYEEWSEYSEISHRRKTKPGSFYLINDSVNINVYSKYMQLIEQSQDNVSKGYPPISESALYYSEDIIRFEVQCKYRKTYSLSKNAALAEDYSVNMYKTLLSPSYCIDNLNHYYNKTIGSGHWYSLQAAVSLIKSHHFNSQKEKRLIDTLAEVNRCRSIARAKSLHYGNDLDTFKRSLKDLSDIGINPVTIPREWGIKRIWNLLEQYHSYCTEEQLSKKMQINQTLCY